MADDQDKDSKTEEPTERKLRRAREKGEVPSSREVGNVTAVLSLFAIAAFVMPGVSAPLAGVLRGVFETAGQFTVGEDVQGMRDIGGVTWGVMRGVGILLAPLLILMLLGAVAGVVLQGDIVMAIERIRPKPEKLSPLAGFKKIFSVPALVEFVKSMLKVLTVGTIGIWITYHGVRDIWQVQGLLPEMLTEFARRTASRMLLVVLVLLVAVAVADVLWKRFEYRRNQRMSLQEVKDEHKDTEGDPQIRVRRMQLRRERARQRIATAVPRATVVLTNPTHFAVALKYESGVDLAPVCVAKGADLLAARIRELAREAEVPIIENKPLARALHDVAEVDKQIPVQHWEAVAAIIGYVMDMQRNIKRPLPEGSSLREED
ncbi:flagellar biosynthesis protein FlhB (plasmid) [Salipiger sp. H15]|uniref:Flagellar biosynthetic protein FlhB n=1 Tax=Alloyangia sp. H15 TaxID=3029062 RepID=A0AAU8AP30_9RHOB